MDFKVFVEVKREMVSSFMVVVKDVDSLEEASCVAKEYIEENFDEFVEDGIVFEECENQDIETSDGDLQNYSYVDFCLDSDGESY